eukprot:GHVU01115496.1.p1 GENE.GHVU01115496.1~~GHVU01115496.1.p1  ORF type:complete len:414 (-),score=45.63 GHVU01115496.1:3529-4770(-)
MAWAHRWVPHNHCLSLCCWLQGWAFKKWDSPGTGDTDSQLWPGDFGVPTKQAGPPNVPYSGEAYDSSRKKPKKLLIRELLAQALYPDTPYQYTARGTPDHMPDLTLEEVREYHKQYYDPNNARFYVYCQRRDSMGSVLMMLEDQLKDYDANYTERTRMESRPLTDVWVRARHTVLCGEKACGGFAFGWALPPDAADVDMWLQLQLLATLTQAFLEDAIRMKDGENVEGGHGVVSLSMDIERDYANPFIVLSVEIYGAADKEGLDNLEAFKKSSLEALYLTGFSKDAMVKALRKLELKMKKGLTKRLRKGMRMFMLAETLWNYGKVCKAASLVCIGNSGGGLNQPEWSRVLRGSDAGSRMALWQDTRVDGLPTVRANQRGTSTATQLGIRIGMSPANCHSCSHLCGLDRSLRKA